MKTLLSITLISIIAFQSSCMLKPVYFDESKWREDIEKHDISNLYATHYEDGKYFNPWARMKERGFSTFLKWTFSKKILYTEEEKSFLPGFIPDLKSRIIAMGDKDFITWIGHGTFLMRLNGEFWLTDPMFSKRALLPKRVTPPAMGLDELNELTDKVNIIISHNHYDHLDKKSIRAMPVESRFFVPLGLRSFIESNHRGAVRELDWWQEVDLAGGIKLICLPAQHWSRRIGQSTNSSLWASYILITPDVCIYFGGDSGFFIGYSEFGRRFPNIDYALIPTTAYHPRWFMHYAHMNSSEAVRAFHDLKAEYFIPTQWGTFQLGDEPPGYPVLDLMGFIDKMELDRSRFITMDIGQIEIIKKTNR